MSVRRDLMILAGPLHREAPTSTANGPARRNASSRRFGLGFEPRVGLYEQVC